MRKIIETASTLALWAVFIGGSTLAILDFFFDVNASYMMKAHLNLISLTPLFAVIIFGSMMVAVRFAKNETTKKSIPSEHAVQWCAEDLLNAQTGKVVDLHFPSTGLACHVVARDEAAAVLHSENQTIHVKVVTQAPELALLPQAF